LIIEWEDNSKSSVLEAILVTFQSDYCIARLPERDWLWL